MWRRARKEQSTGRGDELVSVLPAHSLSTLFTSNAVYGHPGRVAYVPGLVIRVWLCMRVYGMFIKNSLILYKVTYNSCINEMEFLFDTHTSVYDYIYISCPSHFTTCYTVTFTPFGK